MKILEITAETRNNGLQRKTITLPVDDSMADIINALCEQFASEYPASLENKDPMSGFVIEGSGRIKIGLTVCETKQTF